MGERNKEKEKWVLTVEIQFRMSMIWKNRKDRVRNEEMRERLEKKNLLCKPGTSKLRLLGHVCRVVEGRLP